MVCEGILVCGAQAIVLMLFHDQTLIILMKTLPPVLWVLARLRELAAKLYCRICWRIGVCPSFEGEMDRMKVKDANEEWRWV